MAEDCLPFAGSLRLDDSGYASSSPQDEFHSDFQQFTRQNPPKVSENHYQGEDVWSNFGYLCINEKWVDPESQAQLYKAYYNPTGGHNATAELPELDKFRTRAPKIMTAAEQDDFYKAYVFDVEDNVDGEGDPRDIRISLATFARWAASATKGDMYESKVSRPSVSDFVYVNNMQLKLIIDDRMSSQLRITRRLL
jgi:hypothetical protein